MKTVFIIRHAKSDQQFFGNDFERPLNARGLNDAPMMAKRLADNGVNIDLLVASPAIRAKKTAELFANNLNMLTEDIVFVSALYHASSEVFEEVIAALPDSVASVALFSHNPGITHFAGKLGTGTRVDNMPTCAVFAVEADTASWALFANTAKKCILFDYPKK